MPVEKITAPDLDINSEEIRRGPRRPIHLILDNIRSAFNVGSAFRTADAVCLQKLYLCGISAYPPNPKVEKTALGSSETVPWEYYTSSIEAIQDVKSNNIPVCVVELTTKSTSYWEYKFPKPIALVLGHEVYGISEEIFSMADDYIHIPMYGKKTTLNVSTALGVVLFEVVRQWNIAE